MYMDKKIVGREFELGQLSRYYKSKQSEFVAVYGRRRVGKTFLVRNAFPQIDFQYTAMMNVSRREQLVCFANALREQGLVDVADLSSWQEAFAELKRLICTLPKSRKKVIFLDELPWMDKSDAVFIAAFEHFWNSWASARNDIMLVVCGSATSWMMDKLINNRGGLHNRITLHIRLEPFTLRETELYLKSRKFRWGRTMIAECYMIFGGIPYYLSLLDSSLSLAKNVDFLFFRQNAVLRGEFNNLYASLFTNSKLYIGIVQLLGSKKKGLSRDEIVKGLKVADGGTFSKALADLENCGFIRCYTPFDKKKKTALFQLVDFYTLFYLNFIWERKINDEEFWSKNMRSSLRNAWIGYAFEQLCLAHVRQIKQGLGISGVITNVYSWRSNKQDGGAQIDLVIDRNDNSITLCEMKWTNKQYSITAAYEKNLNNKVETFIEENETNKSVFLTMITTQGIMPNSHSQILDNNLVLNNLFA